MKTLVTAGAGAAVGYGVAILRLLPYESSNLLVVLGGLAVLALTASGSRRRGRAHS